MSQNGVSPQIATRSCIFRSTIMINHHKILGYFFFSPAQLRKLMGSAAQNSSGVHWCRRRVRFNEVPEKVPKVPEKVWEALVQSQVRFNRVPQVRFNRVPEKVLEKVPEKVPGGFGAERGQVQQGSGEGFGEGLGGFGAR